MWLTVESGAPCIDPQRPLIGTGTAVANAKAALGTDDEALAIRTLAELGILVPEFVQRVGSVAPGQYVIPAELRKLFDFPHSGVDASGRFELRAEHLTLLRAAVWWTVDANSIDDVLGEGDLWPMPMIDGKRPYGNSSYFQLDMADLLGEPYGHDLRGHAVDDPAKDARLEHLHQETLAALQVFLAHAEPAHPL
ncbi:hypothetical protein [Burkholderia sp. Ac-20353]|uniref:hypothetical protein n=1 Tax=Burkholderia sp. Ac-20353 TaxID=2703894 RepID=UPI001F11BA29|nr:hypothetical protein [Burkholderia sp. Ac-20353]